MFTCNSKSVNYIVNTHFSNHSSSIIGLSDVSVIIPISNVSKPSLVCEFCALCLDKDDPGSGFGAKPLL